MLAFKCKSGLLLSFFLDHALQRSPFFSSVCMQGAAEFLYGKDCSTMVCKQGLVECCEGLKLPLAALFTGRLLSAPSLLPSTLPPSPTPNSHPPPPPCPLSDTLTFSSSSEPCQKEHACCFSCAWPAANFAFFSVCLRFTVAHACTLLWCKLGPSNSYSLWCNSSHCNA